MAFFFTFTPRFLYRVHLCLGRLPTGKYGDGKSCLHFGTGAVSRLRRLHRRPLSFCLSDVLTFFPSSVSAGELSWRWEQIASDGARLTNAPFFLGVVCLFIIRPSWHAYFLFSRTLLLSFPGSLFLVFFCCFSAPSFSSPARKNSFFEEIFFLFLSPLFDCYCQVEQLKLRWLGKKACQALLFHVGGVKPSSFCLPGLIWPSMSLSRYS